MQYGDYEYLCCPAGCWPCGRTYYRNGHVHDYGCCNSTVCNPRAWTYTVQMWTEWLEAEAVVQWLKAEATFKERIKKRPKVHVRYEPREIQEKKDPVEERVKARMHHQ